MKIGNIISSIETTKFGKIEKDDRFKIVYTGNLGIAQDSDFIIDFIKKNRSSDKLSFIIAGHGNKMNELKHLADDLNFDNLYLFDFLHDDEYEKLLLLADLFLLSLKQELSGLASPSKLYSYLAAGKPIIAIVDKNSRFAEFILNENIGVVCDSNSFSEITSLVMTLEAKDDKYYNMCHNSINIFNKCFETEIATEKYVNMMDKLKVGYKDER